MVRDVASRAVVAHFRAHAAPLALLAWDGSGSRLITASVHGHSINVFQARGPACANPIPALNLCIRRRADRRGSWQRAGAACAHSGS